MNNGELLNYALKRRNLLVAMWLMLQQRWFVRSFNFSANLLSWMIIALGVALVTFTVVTFARNVAPVLTSPGTLSYYLLQLLVLVVAFNIYVNYFCATAFSRRIGKAPAAYVYRDPYCTDLNAPPVDDSSETISDEEDDGNDDDDGCHDENVRVESEDPLVSTEPPIPAAPMPKRVGGIQVVRVFGEEPPVRERGSLRHDRDTDDSTMKTMVMETEDEGDGGADVDQGLRRRRSSFLPTRLGRCIGLCVSRGSLGRGTRACRVWLQTCSRHAHRCACVTPWPPATASLEALQELESLAGAAERLGPRQRAFRVLDAPRRYCSHCRRLKAPREHHCAICNECVCKMDHHCPWINNCVDVENQRYFLLFVFWLWVGTFLAAVFVGYGVMRQRRYTKRREALFQQWLRAPAKAALTAELQRLRMPYGPAGVLLTSFPTLMVLGISLTMFLCMTFFLYFNRRLVLENTTVIESIYVDEKRHHVYRSTGFLYHNPYDLGRWWNFLDLFSPAGDPVVRWAVKQLQHSTAGTTSNTARSNGSSRSLAEGPAGANAHQRKRWCSSRVKTVVGQVGVVLWLTAFPTLRPTHSDGVHYITFDALAAGEQISLVQL